MWNITQTAPLCISALFLLACGDSEGGGTAGGGQGGGGQGGSGQGGGCFAPTSFARIEIQMPDGEPLPCEGELEFVEEVVVIEGTARTAGGVLNIDVCLPSQDCAPQEYALSVPTVEGFAIPDGTFVRATMRACGTNAAVLIRNLPTLDGLDNPAGDHTSLWAFVTTRPDLEEIGAAEERVGVMTEFEKVCSTDDPEPSTFASLTVSFPDASVAVTADPLDEAKVAVPSGPQAGGYTVRNEWSGTRGNQGNYSDFGIYRITGN